ncbi:hypothetical protein [Burkholderia pseudomultivorans]|uniref:Uncharacterized protein n=1 Tax=Burkholderia pseudomultivorans TaxID=1207504 RepID=A0A6P2KBM0_9BURK|nr:hypothetical protein [Burkholderia pseudomultivorans]MDR8726510.1 hypothetical protein [Burkholderia pseudomultivorans]MDR8736343.1 hypothetical protein [Burkholderia pseudomultivorans]MDR8742157.1 hypothetical protein [Burkholderia pseudomultivorans]MDR8753941.1 hypothetical protein [Burkholderia pseudomultivorans]MDR8778949.1 hypothetical protein [Burkholderia pseudomultivorans]
MPGHTHISPGGNRYKRVAAHTTTPTGDTSPKIVVAQFKTFWKTLREWTDADIDEYHRTVEQLARQIQTETYWDRKGTTRANRFTCEDFALRILIQFSALRGLPIKLTTGVRSYRNVEIYGESEHHRYDSTMYGYADMVSLTFGAPDIQRTGSNTTRLQTPESILPGDMLVQANDRAGIGHHVQLVTRVSPSSISIMQGNSSGAIVRPLTTIMRIIGRNRADPQNASYAGMRVEEGRYTLSTSGWDYRNNTTGAEAQDFLRQFQLYRWNFAEFNR